MNDVKLGALCWNQYTDWASLLEVGKRADRLGFDTLWTWDHLYPIVGDPHGPIFEGWLTITAWAATTERVRIGLMVGANTIRNPALVAKMATTLDQISGGRAILGLGAAWFEEEHLDFGIEFGSGFPERLRWLGEALPIIRGMLRGEEPSATGPRYAARHVRNDPPPVQARLPILVGGGGEKVTLKLVAQYADANNVGGRLRERQTQRGDPARALQTDRPGRARDRAHDGGRGRRHPRLAGRGPACLRPPVREQPGLREVAGPADRHAGRRRRVPGALCRARIPAPHRRPSGAVRRGIHDEARNRGEADPRARLILGAR
jgi:alkanesulfonate monooxygenase SsuD/methylene tetrahydromethanopterin reductase-like flavin-dependent oxidoreductase (luciferase family)